MYADRRKPTAGYGRAVSMRAMPPHTWNDVAVQRTSAAELAVSGQTAGDHPTAVEFFAGVGLARMGLTRAGFRVTWANDVDPNKAALYRAQWPSDSDDHLRVANVHDLNANDLPSGRADVAWASFPCTDVSLAGDREGLSGAESGTWWAFARILGELADAGNAPPVVAVENVLGLATSDGGKDLHAIIRSLNRLGYTCDVLAIDARHFLPQSRPRLFIVAAKHNPFPRATAAQKSRPDWLSNWMDTQKDLRLHPAHLPSLPSGGERLADALEHMASDDPRWWDGDRVRHFMAQLSTLNAKRLDAMRDGDAITVGTAYRRTRRGSTVWEIREDGLAGCLRAIRGGSSKQAVVEAGRGEHRVRWMTPLEYARLMGAGDFSLRGFRQNQIYFAFGDGVAVPVVEWLASTYLAPLVRCQAEFNDAVSLAEDERECIGAF
jgi:DNA (cytosine-5)-methyltransferase 1